MSKREERRRNYEAYLSAAWRENDVLKSQRRRGASKDNKTLRHQTRLTDEAAKKVPWWKR